MRKRVNPYEGWSYAQLADESNKKYLSGKEARMLHKELKKHDSGLFLSQRYPNLTLYVSITSLLLVLLKLILLAIPQ